MDVPEIEIPQAQEHFVAGTATFVDIRDPDSFQTGHVPGAIHLDNSNVQQFVADTDKQSTVVVYCYHGNSSASSSTTRSKRCEHRDARLDHHRQCQDAPTATHRWTERAHR